MMEPTTVENSSEVEETPCNLCGSHDTELVLTGTDLRRHVPGTFRVVRCARCGLVFVNPRPTAAAIARYYPTDYAPHRATPPSAAERLYYAAFRNLPVVRGARVLDVGCGGGRYLHFLRGRGYEAAGTEVDTAVAERVREDTGFEIYCGMLPDVDIPPESFDAVTLWWVLEHTHDPLATLRAAHRALRPGGQLVVSVQNFASLGRLVFGRFWHHLDLPGHLYQFEPRTLRALLARAGFTTWRLRHDPIAKDMAPSLGYALRLEQTLDRPAFNLASLPFDFAGWALRRSGLITAYAIRSQD